MGSTPVNPWFYWGNSQETHHLRSLNGAVQWDQSRSCQAPYQQDRTSPLTVGGVQVGEGDLHRIRPLPGHAEPPDGVDLQGYVDPYPR